MPVSEVRYALAQVTEQSRAGWNAFAKRVRVNRTALAEVIGLYLGTVEGDLPPWLRELVDQAADLQEERDSRKPE